MNLNESDLDQTLLRLLIAISVKKCRLFLLFDRLNEKMKMDQRLLKSKKRFSSLWRRILNSKLPENLSDEDHTQIKKPFVVNGQLNLISDSESNKENSSSSDHEGEENLSSVKSCVISSSPQCPPQTILKKSQTAPSYHRQTPSSERHATFKEVVKVHEYVVQDSLDAEEHYTSEASLTDEDECSTLRKGFYVDNYPEDDDDEHVGYVVPSNFDTKKLITDGEKANIFRKLNDPDESQDEGSRSDSPARQPEIQKSKALKKSSKTKPKKKKTPPKQELADDLFYDFAC